MKWENLGFRVTPQTSRYGLALHDLPWDLAEKELGVTRRTPTDAASESIVEYPKPQDPASTIGA